MMCTLRHSLRSFGLVTSCLVAVAVAGCATSEDHSGDPGAAGSSAAGSAGASGGAASGGTGAAVRPDVRRRGRPLGVRRVVLREPSSRARCGRAARARPMASRPVAARAGSVPAEARRATVRASRRIRRPRRCIAASSCNATTHAPRPTREWDAAREHEACDSVSDTIFASTKPEAS